MIEFRAFIAGFITFIAIMLILGAIVHMIQGLELALESIEQGEISYVSGLIFILIVSLMSAFKVYLGVKATRIAARHSELPKEN